MTRTILNDFGDTEVHDDRYMLVVHRTDEGIVADSFTADGRDATGTWALDWEGLHNLTQRSTEVVRIVFTVADIEDAIFALDENRGADRRPPLDRDQAMADALEWAKSIADTASEVIGEQLERVIEDGQP